MGRMSSPLWLGADVAAGGYDGELASLHLQRHGPDAVREPALDGGEAGLDGGSGLEDIVEPAGVLPPYRTILAQAPNPLPW